FVNANIYMMMRLAVLLVLVVGAWFTFTGKITNGELVGFVLYVQVLFRPIEKVSALLELYPKGMAGFKRFRELMDISAEVKNKKDATIVENIKGDIAFNVVTFAYATTERPVLFDLRLGIHASKTIAFVGPSWAGKTTICSLIPRF